MDNVVRLPAPRIELPGALRPDAALEDVTALVDRVERLQAGGEMGPACHDRLLRFANAVRYHAYGRRGWRDLVARLEAAIERSACVNAVLAAAASRH